MLNSHDSISRRPAAFTAGSTLSSLKAAIFATILVVSVAGSSGLRADFDEQGIHERGVEFMGFQPTNDYTYLRLLYLLQELDVTTTRPNHGDQCADFPAGWIDGRSLMVAGMLRRQIADWIDRGYLDHVRASCDPGGCWSVRDAADAKPQDNSWYRLTAAGRVLVAAQLRDRSLAAVSPPNRPRPRWNRAEKKLWLGDRLVKHFRRVAYRQFTVLDALETTGWPAEIPNPLTESDGVSPLDQLREAVKSLNKRRVDSGLRFGICHRDRCVYWEVEHDEPDEAESQR